MIRNKKGQFVKGFEMPKGMREKIGLATSIRLKGKRMSPKTEFKKGHPDLVPKEIRKQSAIKISQAHKGMKKPWVTETKKGKPNLAIKGEKNPNWNGGTGNEPYTTDWTDTLKRSIRERDHYICQLCNQYGNAVHHIDYDKKNCNPNNLITLCDRCNSKVNFNRNYWMDYFNKKLWLIPVEK